MFYDRFIELCNQNKEKPTTVLKSIGLSSATPVKWAKGSSPNMDALIGLANHFKCSMDYLCDRKTPAETFTAEEVELILNYRQANKKDQNTVKFILNQVTPSTQLLSREA